MRVPGSPGREFGYLRKAEVRAERHAVSNARGMHVKASSRTVITVEPAHGAQ